MSKSLPLLSQLPFRPPNATVNTLVMVGNWLQDKGYSFTTVTPATQARVNMRDSLTGHSQALNLRDVFGWSRPFTAGLLPSDVIGWLKDADLVETSDGLMRSRVRFSSLGSTVYAHSAFPTQEADAVFFGPDTSRFVALIESELLNYPLRPRARARANILDMGCGAGPGGISAALASAAVTPELTLADINPRALQHAQANAILAGLPNAALALGDLYHAVEGEFDLIIANPPYLVDASERAYRHGGGALGGDLSLRIVREGLPRLKPGGRLILYTGAPIVAGRDFLMDAVKTAVRQAACSLSYRELDPDVFGEELDLPAYADVERIAAVALVARKPVP